jgi:hypothetical protein
MQGENVYDFKPHPEAIVQLSIGFGALNVVVDGAEVEFVPVWNSGEPECVEVWENLK